MIDSVKSIPTNPLGEPFIRARVYSGRLRQSGVKASVEHGHLENLANAFLDDLDPFQLGAVMEWCKGGHARDSRFYFRRNGGRFIEILSAVDDSMAHYTDLRKRRHDAQLRTP